MKNSLKKIVLTAVVLLTYTTGFSMVQDSGVDVSDPASLVAYLSPFIVFVVVQLVKLIKPIVPGWLLGIVIPGVSALLAWLTTLLDNPELSWLAQFGLGLAATFVHQLWKALTSSN